MFERFTDRARAAVTGAEAHARRLGHPYVGTEHALLSLSAGGGVAARALTQVGFDPGRFEQAVIDEVGQGLVTGMGHIPFTVATITRRSCHVRSRSGLPVVASRRAVCEMAAPIR